MSNLRPRSYLQAATSFDSSKSHPAWTRKIPPYTQLICCLVTLKFGEQILLIIGWNEFLFRQILHFCPCIHWIHILASQWSLQLYSPNSYKPTKPGNHYCKLMFICHRFVTKHVIHTLANP